MLIQNLRSSLVIGGTGMLAAATLWLAERSKITLLVARHASGFRIGDGRFVRLDADWKCPTFCNDVANALQSLPPVKCALIWLHEPEPTLGWLLPKLPDARVVLVLGSFDGRPYLPGQATDLLTVRLGSKATQRGRRWLTDKEISDGAIAAMSDGCSGVVGDLRPVQRAP